MKDNFTEIKLSDRQLNIVQSILDKKEKLQKEINDVLSRETDFIITICDAVSVEPMKGIVFEGKSMFVPKQLEPVQSSNEEVK